MASGGEAKIAGANGSGAGGRGRAGYAAYERAVAVEEKRRFSWLVPVIIIACVVVFIMEMFVNDCPAHVSPSGPCVAKFLRRFSFQPFRENPLLGPSSATLEKMGALDRNNVVNQHQGWRLVSSIWLHAGVIHLLVNMLSLLFIGIRLEQQFGFVRIGLVYLISGFGGSVLSALFLPDNFVSVGASGALFGLLGSMLAELFMNWTIYSNKAAAIITLMFIIAINLAVGILPHVDNFAHIGGFLTGFLLGFVLLVRPQFDWLESHQLPQTNQPPKYKAYQYVLWAIALLLLLAGLAVSLVMLFEGKNGNNSCHWCHYLTCVPTSSWSCGT